MFTRITVFFFLLHLVIYAQENSYSYVEYDTITNGYLQVTLDKKMDDLLESKKSRCDLLESYRNKSNTSTHESAKPKVSFSDLCRDYPKLKGYRIQVINTRSSEEAEKARDKVQVQFPQLSSSVILRRPQFKVLLGDYFSKENAANDLTAVKKLYPGALLVVSKIWCSRAQ